MNDSRLIHIGERVLRVRSLGQGTPVMYMHGALGSILEQPFADAVVSKLGVQLVLVERPGFGESTRQEGRTVSTWVEDFCVVLTELGLEKVRLLAWSAGVPYALAAAARASNRIGSISLVSPRFGETEPVDPSPSAVAAFRQEMSRRFGPLLHLLIRSPEAGLDSILAQMPEPDRAMAIETHAMLVASCTEAMRQGPEPAIDEGVAIHTRWPFAIGDIACDVEIWCGGSDAAAESSVRLLAQHLPRARQRVIPGGGHYLVFTHGETILSSIAARRF